MGRLLTRGHPAAAAAVQAMIAGRPPQAIVFAGPAGVGKTTLALDLAAGLLCAAPDRADRPCRECRGCRLVAHGSHADLHRLAPSGPGQQVRIGDRSNPEPGTVRRLIADLALLPVEGGARVAIVERADRLNEDAQSALLKILEEPPAGVTIALCADRDDLLLPTVHSRCVRIRLGPVAVREIEALIEDAAVADAARASRLARLASGRPGTALALAMAPDAVTARDEIARTLLDVSTMTAARRLAVSRELLARSAELIGALDRVGEVRLGGDPAANVTGPAAKGKGRGRRGSGPAASPAAVADPPAGNGGDAGADADAESDDAETVEAVAVRAPATERRRAAVTLVDIWRDVARDLLLVALGEERRLRDPGLLDDLRATAARIPPDEIRAFVARLATMAELLEANVSPELAIDALLLAWPRRTEAA